MLRNRIQKFNLKVSRYGRIPPHIKLFAEKILSLILCFYALQSAFCIFAFAQERLVYDDQGKRNPFIPLVTSSGRIINLDQESNSELRLDGIIYDGRGLSYAIVNQEVVRISDWVGNYQVLKIEKNKVIFLKNGEPKEVELKKEE